MRELTPEDQQRLTVAIGQANNPSRLRTRVPDVTLSHAIQFASLMLQRLEVKTATQGEWRDWHPDFKQLQDELRLKTEKLVGATARGAWSEVSKHAADLANFAMKAWEDFGE